MLTSPPSQPPSPSSASSWPSSSPGSSFVSVAHLSPSPSPSPSPLDPPPPPLTHSVPPLLPQKPPPNSGSFVSPSVSLSDTRTAAGTLRIQIPSPIRKSPRSTLPLQNTVQHRSPPYPHTHRVHTAPRMSLVHARPPHLPPTLSSLPHQHTVQTALRGLSTSPGPLNSLPRFCSISLLPSHAM